MASQYETDKQYQVEMRMCNSWNFHPLLTRSVNWYNHFGKQGLWIELKTNTPLEVHSKKYKQPKLFT